jgi:hypothetical protein
MEVFECLAVLNFAQFNDILPMVYHPKVDCAESTDTHLTRRGCIFDMNTHPRIRHLTTGKQTGKEKGYIDVTLKSRQLEIPRNA